MAVSDDQLRDAMRRWATGVTVVTAAHENVYHGMTVSSFTSVSLDPPLILVSLERSTRTRQLVLDSAHFAVNVLHAGQEDISDRFAGRIPDVDDRFVGLEFHTLESGAPLLEDALAWLDCRVSAVIEMATHTIIIGHVIAVRAPALDEGDGDPLLYYNRSYRQLK
jgi:flavin reductase (DIM6/NTAB) family NADH-FMN oxidoreductase RutF